jgi:hypothetical protein
MTETRRENAKRTRVQVTEVKRTKTVLLNRSEEDRKIFRKEREERGKKIVQKNARATFEVKYNRKHRKSNRKELEVDRSAKLSQGREDSYQNQGEEWKKRREKELKRRLITVNQIKQFSKEMSRSEEKKQFPTDTVAEWKEQVARVGTGYRVRKDEKDPRKRRFDVGYADLKTYKRKEGREAVVEGSNMGRTLTAKGKDARVKVINAVCDIEKRRPASEYTGSGILRKSLVGKLKLKPTKASGKE